MNTKLEMMRLMEEMSRAENRKWMQNLVESALPTGAYFISAKQLRAFTGLSGPTLWRMRKRGQLPEPERISPGRVAWRRDAIVTWATDDLHANFQSMISEGVRKAFPSPS